jgi:stage IV sporulation protein FB
MRWSFHIARIAGIDVKVHVTFFLLLAFYGLSFYGQGGVRGAIQGVLLISLIFFCVLLHEFGHAVAARRYGIHTPDITLLPIGGVARLERMPDKPSEELVVAVAGPLVNVVIAAILGPFALPEIWHALHPSVLERFEPSLVSQLFVANVMLIAFNLIPAFPMDGGRILRSLLAMRMDYARATGIAATIGQGLAFIGGLYGLLHGPPLLALVALFVFFGAQSEAAHAQMRSVSNGLRVRDAMVLRFEALPRHATLNSAVEALLHTSQHDFPIVDDEGAVCGVLTQDDLIVALRKTGGDTPVAEVMRTGLPSLSEGMYFDRAFATMQQADCPALPVVDHFGRLVGMFTRENIGELMMIQTAMAGSAQAARRTPPPLPIRT